MLEARLIDYEGNEIEGYFWATNDSEDAISQSYDRAQEEGLIEKCSSIHIYDENGEHLNMICL